MSEKDFTGSSDFTGPNRRQSVLTDEDRHFLASILRTDGSRRVFGFRVQEVAVIASFLVLLVAFYIRTSDVLLQFSEFSARTQRFMDNSDVYHSTVLGMQFSQGKPENAGYDVGRARERVFTQQSSRI